MQEKFTLGTEMMAFAKLDPGHKLLRARLSLCNCELSMQLDSSSTRVGPPAGGTVRVWYLRRYALISRAMISFELISKITY